MIPRVGKKYAITHTHIYFILLLCTRNADQANCCKKKKFGSKTRTLLTAVLWCVCVCVVLVLSPKKIVRMKEKKRHKTNQSLNTIGGWLLVWFFFLFCFVCLFMSLCIYYLYLMNVDKKNRNLQQISFSFRLYTFFLSLSLSLACIQICFKKLIISHLNRQKKYVIVLLVLERGRKQKKNPGTRKKTSSTIVISHY